MPSVQSEEWCCDSWCYVNEACPIAKKSWLGIGFYFSYETCDLACEVNVTPVWQQTTKSMFDNVHLLLVFSACDHATACCNMLQRTLCRTRCQTLRRCHTELPEILTISYTLILCFTEEFPQVMILPPPPTTSKPTAVIHSVDFPPVVVLVASAAAAAAGVLEVPGGVLRMRHRPPPDVDPGQHHPRSHSDAVPLHHQQCEGGHHHHRCHRPRKEGEGVAVWVDKRLAQLLADVPPATWSILVTLFLDWTQR